MSQISEKGKEEIVVTIDLVKQYPHISPADKRTIMDTLIKEKVGATVSRYDSQESCYATIVAKKAERIELAVRQENRDFWVGVLRKTGNEFEKLCRNISGYRVLQRWDKKLLEADE